MWGTIGGTMCKGARDAGCYAWLMGDDVKTFDDVLERIRTGNLIDSASAILVGGVIKVDLHRCRNTERRLPRKSV